MIDEGLMMMMIVVIWIGWVVGVVGVDYDGIGIVEIDVENAENGL